MVDTPRKLVIVEIDTGVTTKKFEYSNYPSDEEGCGKDFLIDIIYIIFSIFSLVLVRFHSFSQNLSNAITDVFRVHGV